jgi:hypothetical protein
LTPDSDEELGVGFGDVEVVGEHGHTRHEVFEEGSPLGLLPASSEFDADPQLGDRDGGDGHVVLVSDEAVEVGTGAFGVDDEGGVEEESGQGRSSTSMSSRREASSRLQLGSAPWRRSTSLTAAPVPPRMGSR